MRFKLFLLLIFLFAINDHDVQGRNVEKVKSMKVPHKNTKQKEGKARNRRSLDDDIDKLLTSDKDLPQHGHIVEGRGRVIKLQSNIDKELPFWGSRGRRDSSEEVVANVHLPTSNQHKYFDKNENLYKYLLNYQNKLRRDEGDSPFWGNRGRRDSDEESAENDINLFWANRGRRQDEEPFWGTRGRREESPFWGNRDTRDDDEPFWGNRGRRQDQEPFWGNRGRRESMEKFGNRNENNKVRTFYINEVDEPLNEYRDKLKVKLKNSIISSIDNIENKIENFARNRREEAQSPFWMNRGRDSKLKSLFNGKIRNRLHHILSDQHKELPFKYIEPNTVHDDRIYAEEPRYILVERSSRSSAEDDPFFISRGKKYSDYNLENGTRGRRGAIEELVKSVRNDPYYIARGKKDNDIKIENSTEIDHLYKTKELICSTIDLLMTKFQGNKVKRDLNDTERNRRTILKKLALQLQMDPYFVSRGKKSQSINNDSKQKSNVEDFISKILIMCA